MVYPRKIAERIGALRHIRSDINASAEATAANFVCGSFVRLLLSIDTERHIVTNAQFSSNGCGFMLASADVLAESLAGKHLSELHGLDETELISDIQNELGEIPAGRLLCITACIDSLRAAFADFRARQIEEFQGEKALICTCFGVSEETIQTVINKDPLITVEDVAAVCRAGRGCGSCRMLIQELIDAHVDTV